MLMYCNEGEERVVPICIRFGSCEVRRLTLALLISTVGQKSITTRIFVCVLKICQGIRRYGFGSTEIFMQSSDDNCRDRI